MGWAKGLWSMYGQGVQEMRRGVLFKNRMWKNFPVARAVHACVDGRPAAFSAQKHVNESKAARDI